MVDAEQLFLSALEHYKAGNVQQALEMCTKILQVHPRHFNALHMAGMIKSQLSDYDSSFDYLSRALEIIPSHAYANYAIGNVLRTKGHLDEAIASYRKALQARPDFTECYFALGNLYEEKHMFAEAATCYREVVKIDPHHSHAYARLGFSLYNLRKLDDAVTFLEKAIQLNPSYDEAYCCLGMIFREKGQYDEALLHLRKALAINPQSAWAYTLLGVVLHHKGQAAEGKKYLHRAIEINAKLPEHRKSMEHLLNRESEIAEDAMNPSIRTTGKMLIVVSVYNRKCLTALSLAQTKRYKSTLCRVQVYNDHSTEYDNTFLSPFADEVIQLPDKMGIDSLRWHQFKEFLDTDFDFLYLTDNDVIHDPRYVDELKRLYLLGKGKLPVSLFNNIFMLQPRLILHYTNGIFIKTAAPGASMFFDRDMVEKILAVSNAIGDALDYLPWDNKAVACLGLPWVTPETSYLEHFGAGGLHSDNYERERAINLTEYLEERRSAILSYLLEGGDLSVEF